MIQPIKKTFRRNIESLSIQIGFLLYLGACNPRALTRSTKARNSSLPQA
jgi:hypothetical protein